MLDKPIRNLRESILSDLRRDCCSSVHHGFELLADEAALPRLRETIDAWFQFSGAIYVLRHLQRYIVGFGTLDSRFAVATQPATSWIFFQASEPLPSAWHLLYYALRRSILVRYYRSGVPINHCTRRRRLATSGQLAERLMRKMTTDECA